MVANTIDKSLDVHLLYDCSIHFYYNLTITSQKLSSETKGYVFRKFQLIPEVTSTEMYKFIDESFVRLFQTS